MVKSALKKKGWCGPVRKRKGLENGQLMAPYPESNLDPLPEVLPEVLPEASSSLSRSEYLLRPRPLETDGVIKGFPRQESSSHKALPPRSVVPKGPTSTETGGKAQEALRRRSAEWARWGRPTRR